MKKIIAAALFASIFASATANAGTTPTSVELQDGYNAIGDATTNINLARQFNIEAINGRAGFIKNDFEATLSANVFAALTDDAANNRMGVVAGSNKGYTVFTGSSVGGSVSQCGDPVAKNTAGLATTLVTSDTLVLANANGCGR
jgi:hypothetical protein